MHHEVKDSSIVSTFSYDKNTQKLTVTLSTGKTFEYSYVPKQTYHNMVDAKSKGSFFANVIKNKYRHREI